MTIFDVRDWAHIIAAAVAAMPAPAAAELKTRALRKIQERRPDLTADTWEQMITHAIARPEPDTSRHP